MYKYSTCKGVPNSNCSA